MINNQMKDTIHKMRQYLDYIEEHYDNVLKALEVAKTKWQTEPVIYDDFRFSCLEYEVRRHDLNKLSAEEFVAYRKEFYPTDAEKLIRKEIPEEQDKIDQQFEVAWAHHKMTESYHWQTINTETEFSDVQLAHMILDWAAMGYKFGDTALTYYEKNRVKIDFSNRVDAYVMRLLKLFYAEEVLPKKRRRFFLDKCVVASPSIDEVVEFDGDTSDAYIKECFVEWVFDHLDSAILDEN